MPTRKLISFDWAMKKLLRSKANFDILEGFLSELLREDIRIEEVLESESNKLAVRDKFNRFESIGIVGLMILSGRGRKAVLDACDDDEIITIKKIVRGGILKA